MTRKRPQEEEEPRGVPEWVVTFGDMMSLLLTFFIMLVALSEIKQEEKYQALIESLRRQFGHASSLEAVTPGPAKPRNAVIAKLATMGRARRLDSHRGGDKVSAPVGDHPRVMIVRPGSKAAIGTVLVFADDTAELSEANQRNLERQALEFGGKPQKIEIRGHTSQRPLPADSPYRDNWHLAYERCRNTMNYLVELGIEPVRIRMSVAGPNEPYHTGTDPARLRQNSRVEVFLLDEVVEDLQGGPADRENRFAIPPMITPD